MINIGIAGCGYWGPNLVRNFSSLGEAQVATVCDLSQERLDHVKKLFPWVRTTSNYEEMVKDKDIHAVAISTPPRLHHRMALASLSNGKHTFIEKPMATSTEECREMISLADDNGLTLAVGHIFVYASPVRKIKEIIQSGALGDILYVSSRRLNLGLFQKDINVAWDLAPHDISIILHVLDRVPSSVNCQGKAHVHPGVEDVINMTLNFDNGGFATIQNSWLDPNKVREMTFVGTRRMLMYNDLEPIEKIKIYDKRVDPPPYYDTFAEFQFAYHYGDIYSPHISQVEPLRAECQHFVDCIRNKCQPEAGGLEGMRVVSILEAADQSLRSGGGIINIERRSPRMAAQAVGGQA